MNSGLTAEPGEPVLQFVAWYAYDVHNRRTRKLTLFENTHYTWDGWNMTDELDWSWTATKSYLRPGGITENLGYATDPDKDGNWTLYSFVSDHIGNIVKVTDASGAIVEQYDYDVYGQRTIFDGTGSQAGVTGHFNFVGFTGHYHDYETGLIYMRNRYYSTSTGRFLTNDRIGIWGTKLHNGNGYCYAGSAPTWLTDPLGLDPWKFLGDVIAGVGDAIYGVGAGVVEGVAATGRGILRTGELVGEVAAGAATLDPGRVGRAVGSYAKDAAVTAGTMAEGMVTGVVEAGKNLFSGDVRKTTKSLADAAIAVATAGAARGLSGTRRLGGPKKTRGSSTSCTAKARPSSGTGGRLGGRTVFLDEHMPRALVDMLEGQGFRARRVPLSEYDTVIGRMVRNGDDILVSGDLKAFKPNRNEFNIPGLTAIQVPPGLTSGAGAADLVRQLVNMAERESLVHGSALRWGGTTVIDG